MSSLHRLLIFVKTRPGPSCPIHLPYCDGSTSYSALLGFRHLENMSGISIRVFTARLSYAQITESPQNQLGDEVLYVKARSLNGYATCLILHPPGVEGPSILPIQAHQNSAQPWMQTFECHLFHPWDLCLTGQWTDEPLRTQSTRKEPDSYIWSGYKAVLLRAGRSWHTLCLTRCLLTHDSLLSPTIRVGAFVSVALGTGLWPCTQWASVLLLECNEQLCSC